MPNSDTAIPTATKKRAGQNRRALECIEFGYLLDHWQKLVEACFRIAVEHSRIVFEKERVFDA